MQLVVREVRIGERVEIAERPTGGRRRLNSAGAIAQMPMDVAFTADGLYAYIPCAFSNNVLKIDTGTNPPATLLDIPVGEYPDGIVLSPTMDRAYVANSLSRSVSVINTNADSVVSAITSTRETLPPNVLNGKKLFNTSLGRMSTDARITCAGCHPDAGPDGFTWDFTQFGAGLRNTRSPRVLPMMAPLLSAGNWDEVQDAEWSIENVHHGQGLADGPEPPSVGAPNAGRSQDLDDIAAYLASLGIRDESPFRNADQSLTPSAQAGKAAFVKAECPSCHPEPLFTDKVRHDVGTYLIEENETGCGACHGSAFSPQTSPHGRASAGPTVPSGYLGFITPSLCSVYDTDPYLHNGLARYLQAVFAALNLHDQHGRTSLLSTTERFDLITYVRSIVRGREDVTAPRIEFARAIGLTEVIVRFLEPVDPGSATDISNYTIDNGVVVLSASLDPFSTFMGRDGLTVHLFTTPHELGQTHTVTVRGVQDMSLNANTIPFPGISASYTCENEATFRFSNVDSLYTSRLGRDTYVDAGEPTMNFGHSTGLSVGSNGSAKRAMVMADFYPMLSTMIADSADIVSAKLRLRLRDQASSEPVTIYAYRLLKYFVEGSGGEAYGNPYPNQTNWESAREGVLSWGAPGVAQSTPGVEGDATSDYLGANDRAFTPEDSVVVSTVGEVAEWDVTHSARWAFANPYYWDFGYVLVAGSEGPGSEKVFHSFQSPDDPPGMNRPSLVITVRAESPVGVPFADAGETAGYALGPIWPNPTRGPMTFALSIPREELVTLRLFDVTGRAVATIVDGRLSPGRQEIAWDGKNAAGQEVSPGVFLYRVKAGRFSQVGRVVVLR
jgi:cytochrome c peroxidase